MLERKDVMEGISEEEAVRSVGPGWEKIVRAVYALLEPGLVVSEVKERGPLLLVRTLGVSGKNVPAGVRICGEPGRPSGKGRIKTRCEAHLK